MIKESSFATFLRSQTASLRSLIVYSPAVSASQLCVSRRRSRSSGTRLGTANNARQSVLPVSLIPLSCLTSFSKTLSCPSLQGLSFTTAVTTVPKTSSRTLRATRANKSVFSALLSALWAGTWSRPRPYAVSASVAALTCLTRLFLMRSPVLTLA